MPGAVTGGAVKLVAAAAIAAGALAVPAGVAHAAGEPNIVYPQPSPSAANTTQWGPAYSATAASAGWVFSPDTSDTAAYTVVPADFADAL